MRKIFATLSLLATVGALAGCEGSSRHSRDATPAGRPPSTPAEHAIAQVISSPPGRGFRFFPHGVDQERCVIGGATLRIRGVCSTRVLYNWGGGGPVVVFTERWPWPSFHYGAAPRRPQQRSWRFVVGPDGHVSVAGQAGDFPPQYVRCARARRPRVGPPARERGLICLT